MKKILKLISPFTLALFFMLGCASVNEGLDKTGEGAKEAGKPLGKVMNIPGSAMEGAAEGAIKNQDKENPFNR
ncbi:MAG TPA: hypothetical protein QF468_13435 [Nitrospinota bacterium]|nr:hypothetical protein [Nitrospinota bacterium]